MRNVKYLLVGGGLASLHAAKKIRKNDASGTLLLVGDDPLPPYHLPSLSKEYLRGIKVESELIYETESDLAAQAIECRLATSVQSLDADLRQATLDGGETVRFEKLLLAPGTRPRRLDVPGSGLPGVHYLRTMADSRGLAADLGPGRRAVVIGAGFIGLETAASLIQIGLTVAVVEAMPEIWPRFADPRLAAFVRRHCEARGVRFLTGERVTGIAGPDRARSVRLASGAVLDCDLVCIGVGVVPNVEVAHHAGLKVENGIVVDERMQTSRPGIFAAGDAANYPDPVAGRRRRAEHWGHAEYSGQIAGANMSGGAAVYDFVSYVWSDIFDLHIEAAGDEAEIETVIARGAMSPKGFTMLYLRDNRLSSYCGVNASPKEFATLRKLIRTRTPLDGKHEALADPLHPLKTLLT
jgi:3-phenylpropionate/trans-cinnamate dioxygenase ferredoxin reductase subunit